MDIKYTKKKDLVERKSDEVNKWERKVNALRKKASNYLNSQFFKIEYEKAVQTKIRLAEELMSLLSTNESELYAAWKHEQLRAIRSDITRLSSRMNLLSKELKNNNRNDNDGDIFCSLDGMMDILDSMADDVSVIDDSVYWFYLE